MGVFGIGCGRKEPTRCQLTAPPLLTAHACFSSWSFRASYRGRSNSKITFFFSPDGIKTQCSKELSLLVSPGLQCLQCWLVPGCLCTELPSPVLLDCNTWGLKKPNCWSQRPGTTPCSRCRQGHSAEAPVSAVLCHDRGAAPGEGAGTGEAAWMGTRLGAWRGARLLLGPP